MSRKQESTSYSYIRRLYEEGDGYMVPGGWKTDSDSIITPEIISAIYILLGDNGFLPKFDQPFCFISPTANIATHEQVIFDIDSRQRQATSTFLVGDLCELPLHMGPISNSENNHLWQYFRWDAQSLPVPLHSADLIWDRKGWLWHVSRNEDPQETILALRHYYEVLKPNGCIVIDNIAGFEEQQYSYLFDNYGKHTLTYLISVLLARAGVIPRLTLRQMLPIDMFLQAEISTFDLLSQLFKQYPHFRSFLNTHFTITELGKGAEAIAVLQKKL